MKLGPWNGVSVFGMIMRCAVLNRVGIIPGELGSRHEGSIRGMMGQILI